MKNITANSIIPNSSKSQITNNNKLSFSFRPIDAEEVSTYINDLDKTKGPGIDQISNRIIKESNNLITPHLTALFNRHIKEGTYPTNLKIARCVPVYKGNNADPYEPANYRPISILGGINKVLEKSLHSQMSHYLEDQKLLPGFQYGYRKGHNTQQAIAEFCNGIETNRNKNLVSIAVFMDLSKAFDTVNKELLLNKLKNLGFNQISTNLINNYMTDRHFCFKNKTDEVYCLKHGVPQGSVLGPLLFLVYIHDMKNICKDITKIVYADDTTLIITGRTKEEATNNCNIVLDIFYKYFTYNKLTINENKTKYMVYNSNRRTHKTNCIKNITMNNVILEEVKNIKFLGIIINNKLNWSDHKLHIKTKICKSIGILYNCRKILKHNDLLSMYRTFVEPFFLYCLPIWGSAITPNTGILCKIQNKTLRILFECRRTADAWLATNNKILRLEQLYSHETAKLCFKHHTNSLPLYFSETVMPTTPENDNIPHYHLRNNTIKQYNYQVDQKYNQSFTNNCITTWNNLPDNLKKMTYNNMTYQQFKLQSKKELLGIS